MDKSRSTQDVRRSPSRMCGRLLIQTDGREAPGPAIWLQDLDPEDRRALFERSGLSPWAAIPCLLLALWLGTAWVVTTHPGFLPRAATFLVAGIALAAMDIVLHEAAHGNLARPASLNRWAGFVFGAPVLVPVSAYRYYHLRHHRHSLETSATEGWLAGTPAYLLAVPFAALRDGKRGIRRTVALETALIVALVVGTVLLAGRTGHMRALVDAWLLPLLFAVGVTSLRGMTETIAQRLVSGRASVVERRLATPFRRLISDHLEHHLCPSVPWRHLGLLGRLARRDYEASPFSAGSYLVFLWERVERGIARDA